MTEHFLPQWVGQLLDLVVGLLLAAFAWLHRRIDKAEQNIDRLEDKTATYASREEIERAIDRAIDPMRAALIRIEDKLDRKADK